MQIVVIGSGIIGVTSAYYLARRGYNVSVIDRQESVGMETSFANAGQISPGYSAPWAAPGIPLKAVKWLLSKHSPLVIRPKPDWEMLRFILMMLRNCTAPRYNINKGRMQRIAEYSRRALIELREETGIQYDHRCRGTLQLFRTERQLADARKDTNVLDACAVPYELLNAEQCINVEPALHHVRDKIRGGLRLPNDETGDCFKFTTELAVKAAELGVKFLSGVTVNRLITDGDQISGLDTDQGIISADQYLVASGSYSTQLLRPAGIDIPVYPVKGYSITAEIVSADDAPLSTIMDETYKVAITRLGNRVRVAGTAELTGYDMRLRESGRNTIRHVVSDLFPRAVDLSDDHFWTGLRPMTPDGTPIIGRTPFRNLVLNTGHGTLGWTMACGSGRLVADLIADGNPEISLQDLGMARYGFADRTAGRKPSGYLPVKPAQKTGLVKS